MSKIVHESIFRLVVFVLSMSFSAKSLPQEVTTLVDVSKSSVRIAEPLEFVVTVSAPLGTIVSFPIVVEKLGEFEVVRQRDWFDIPDPNNPKMRNWTRRFQLESMLTGDLTIPALEIHTTFDSLPATVRTEERQIHVVSVLENRPDPMNIRDIKSEFDVGLPAAKSSGWLLWLAGVVGGIAILGFVIGQIGLSKKQVSAKRWAIDELESLRRSEFSNESDPDVIFSKIETTLREYLETELEFPATTQTSSELLASVDHFVAAPTMSLQLTELLRNSEHAKYAGQVFEASECNHAIDRAIEMIECVDSDNNANHDPLAGASQGRTV